MTQPSSGSGCRGRLEAVFPPATPVLEIIVRGSVIRRDSGARP
ncbi:hypothetical protein [Salinispora sp. H7-4]|nr:hypothetical protein [Salinispora sp. H7-4]